MRTSDVATPTQRGVRLADAVIHDEVTAWAGNVGIEGWPIVETAVVNGCIAYAFGSSVNDAVDVAKDVCRTFIARPRISAR